MNKKVLVYNTSCKRYVFLYAIDSEVSEKRMSMCNRYIKYEYKQIKEQTQKRNRQA